MNEDSRIIELSMIDEPPQAMRSDIPRDAVFELAKDIKRNGLINPITVRPVGDRFEVVAGHRRLLAHRYGGLPTIRCIVRDLSDDETFAIMTSENLKRAEVPVVDEATHASRAVEYCKGDLDAAAKMCGESRYWVETRLAIAALPDDLKTALREEKIKMGVALALGKITDDGDRASCLSMAITQGASVVVANFWVAQWEAGLFGNAAAANGGDPNAPSLPPPVVMLRCAIDGKEHPATDMISVLVWRENLGFVTAMREHLETERIAAAAGTPADPAAPQS